jgi:hypothetical protein
MKRTRQIPAHALTRRDGSGGTTLVLEQHNNATHAVVKDRRGVRSAGLPFGKLEEDDAVSFVKAGWRVKSRTIHVLPA